MTKKKVWAAAGGVFFLGATVSFLFWVPPLNWGRVGLFFLLLFLTIFCFLLLTNWGGKRSAWIASWLVILLFLRSRQAGGLVYILVSLLLWALFRLTP
ncbi:hypothetical protein J7J95_01675 [bacterium]|nr:hypothetical protein [bacterium]